MLPLVRLFKRKSHFAWDGCKPYSYGKVADKNIRGERMTCSAYLPQLQDEGVYYYANPIPDQPARPRRRRSERRSAVGTHDTGRIRLISRDGVKGTAACVMLAALVCTLGVATLVGRSRVIEAGKRVSDIQSRIETVTRRNEELETEIAMSEAEVNISYKAVQMGMISAKGADVIYLTAPKDAEMILSASGSGIVGAHLATILGD
ncbi:MAG: hypothetical protein IJ507_01300 [Clostridia bacterium]|nr:hypothetical protein [Clostridia bacterium]